MALKSCSLVEENGLGGLTRPVARDAFVTLFLTLTWLSVCCPASGTDHLTDSILPDADFRNAKPQENITGGWRWDPIRQPSNVRVNENGSITLQGYQGFLHSPYFPTRHNTAVSYQISAQVSGKGEMRIETVWWDQHKGRAAPHIEVIATKIVLSEEPTRVEATAHPGSDAAYGQIRFVQQSTTPDGLLLLSQPAIHVVPRRFKPGDLLLALDAAQPGQSPTDHWQDLTGLNRPFQVIGAPLHDPQQKVYHIDGRENYFEGALEDESRFDFDTAQSTGHMEPFTLVVYASLDGLSHGGLINKVELRKSDPVTGAMLDAPGWFFKIGWDNIGTKFLEMHQMLNNLHNRSISKHGGTDGQNLSIQGGEMHLFVMHVPGDGIASNMKAYMDGSLVPEKNVPWPGGSLSKRSIKNDVPLRIGGGMPFQAKGHPLFTGSIGFIEIWKGRGLWKGMSPEQYGKTRWNNGLPTRGLILQQKHVE